MMDSKPGGRPRAPPPATKPRLRVPSDDALAHRWEPQSNVSPLTAFNGRTQHASASPKRSEAVVSLEQLKLYPSYVRATGSTDMPYEAHVQGWLYVPGVNRKGRLMAAAIERLVGNPGKYSSIEDAAAHEQAESAALDGAPPSSDEPSMVGGLWAGLRPAMFRTRSAKGSAPNSRPASAGVSRVGSPEPEHWDRVPGQSGQTTPQGATTPQGVSAPQSPQSSAEPSPSASAEDLLALSAAPVPPKRPGIRRTTTYTFDARSNPKGKAASSSSQARREQKHIVRERLAALVHKSLAMRSIEIAVYSEPDARNHRKRRTFWADTDDSGRFGKMCRLPFYPDRISVSSGIAVGDTECYYVPLSGVSVISDIDDTVRHTGVTKSKRELLQNVLVKGYDQCQIDGVCEWFQHMADAGATFHYVSNSPWQLYDIIRGYLDHHAFPKGSIHLKRYAGVFEGLTEPAKGRKRATLEKILHDFPQRKFILVGDSGEADLEAYSELARKFPSQVLAIYIRDITLPNDEPLYDPSMHYAHRRHHSADVAVLGGALSMTQTDSAPQLPPRRRKDRAPDLPPRRSLLSRSPQPHSPRSRSPQPYSPPSQSPPQSPPSDGEADAAGLHPLTESSRPSLAGDNSDLPTITATAPSSPKGSSASSAASTTASSVASSGASAAASLASPSSPSGAAPKLPPRPKLLRRTSSKIMDSVSLVASASSHAVGSAARLLGPHPGMPPSGSDPGGSSLPAASASKAQNYKQKPRPPRLSNLDINDSPEKAQSSHRRGIDSFSGSGLYLTASRSSTSPSTSVFNNDTHESGVYIPNSEDYVDVDRVDKRSENWKARLVKQHRLLPDQVVLKAWRDPKDVESQSLQFISGNKSPL